MDSHTNASTPIDVYQLITENIVDHFNHGTIPWHMSWTDAGIPTNVLSNRQYRGINVWLLVSLGYESNLFITWDQLKSIGGSVQKDEKGHIVAYWKSHEQNNGKGNGQTAKQMLGYYRVFNVAQCRDIPVHLMPNEDAVTTPHDPFMHAQSILNAMPDMPIITFQGKQRPHYNSEHDEIVLPKMKNFETSGIYYSTVFHQLIHAAGSEKRVHRKTLIDAVPFGTDSYTMEALIAEMGSALLSGISGIPLHKSTVTATARDAWSTLFKNDTRFITKAAGHAQRAVDYILHQQQSELTEEASGMEESRV